jgi:Xaa-Pro aminopeptidase
MTTTPRIYDDRIERLRDAMAAELLDALLVRVEENRRYLSGFTGADGRFDESAGSLLITESELILATDSRYETQARNEAPLFTVHCYRKGFFEELPALLEDLSVARLGFEKHRLSVNEYETMQTEIEKAGLEATPVGTENLVEDLRIIKSEAEIDTMRRALAIAETAFRETTAGLKPGMTEREAAWNLEKAMREAGADGISFPVIVASGKNAALPHAVPTNKPLIPGEPILIDWGARLHGYCSDSTRMAVIGTPREPFRSVFDTVKSAHINARSTVRDGASGKAVDAVARDLIEVSPFAGKFGHGLGHGVGLAVHERPRVSPLKDETLAAGMVFTVEPGVYLPEWGGIRLENMVVVRHDGAEVLNTLDLAPVFI